MFFFKYSLMGYQNVKKWFESNKIKHFYNCYVKVPKLNPNHFIYIGCYGIELQNPSTDIVNVFDFVAHVTLKKLYKIRF